MAIPKGFVYFFVQKKKLVYHALFGLAFEYFQNNLITAMLLQSCARKFGTDYCYRQQTPVLSNLFYSAATNPTNPKSNKDEKLFSKRDCAKTIEADITVGYNKMFHYIKVSFV